MSVQAIGWALDESQASGNDRLVMIVMCHHAEEGYSWMSRATLRDETRLSESTITRCQNKLVELGEIAECSPESGPPIYLALPRNRRPRLFELTGFLGSHFADSIHRRAHARSGGAQGANRGRAGVRATTSDQAERDAIGNKQSANTLAPPILTDNDKAPDPGCVRCHGEGTFQSAIGDARPNGAGPVRVRCSCTWIEDPVFALIRGER